MSVTLLKYYIFSSVYTPMSSSTSWLAVDQARIFSDLSICVLEHRLQLSLRRFQAYCGHEQNTTKQAADVSKSHLDMTKYTQEMHK